MRNQIRILALAGSLRHDSYNHALLRVAASLAPQGGVRDQIAGLAAELAEQARRTEPIAA